MKTFKIVLFWIVSFTWGLPMSLFGGICALVMLAAKRKPKRFHGYIYFETGSGWGGFEGGPFFFVNSEPRIDLIRHEAGHGVQNLMFGPLMPFVISIPSAVRYWIRRIKTSKGLGYTLPPYDAIWFEKSATDLGNRFFGPESA